MLYKSTSRPCCLTGFDFSPRTRVLYLNSNKSGGGELWVVLTPSGVSPSLPPRPRGLKPHFLGFPARTAELRMASCNRLSYPLRLSISEGV